MYTSTISTIRGEQILIQIEGTGVGSGELILAGTDPIVIEYKQDNLFNPLKMSACSVSILTQQPLFDLYSGKLNNITLKVYRAPYSGSDTFSMDNAELLWFGFLTPNVYSNEYKDTYDKLTLEFVDPLSAMDNVKFKRFGDNFFATFQQYITQALTAVGANSVITTIEGIPSSLASVGCMQRNYIDETEDDKDGAMTWKEVMESIMRYMNRTAYIYKGKLMIYDPIDSDKTSKEVSTVGFAGNKGNISLGDLYNKVTVVANNNPHSNDIPALFNDNAIVHNNVCVNNDNTHADYFTKVYNDNTYIVAYFAHDNYFLNDIWGDIKYSTSIKQQDGGVLDFPGYNRTCMRKITDYVTEKGKPASLSWKTTLQLCEAQLYRTNDIIDSALNVHYYGDDTNTNHTTGFFKIRDNKQPQFLGQSGYFILSMKYIFENANVQGQYNDKSEVYGKGTNDADARFRDDKFKAELSVGNMYWNGETWQNSYASFYLTHRNKADDVIFWTEKSIDNTVDYEWNLADSQEGYAIPLPLNVLSGKVNLKIWADDRITGTAQACTPLQYLNGSYYNGIIYRIQITSLKLVYTTSDTVEDIFNLEEYNPDITYTNEIDAGNIKELDDVEFTTNTYTSRAVSYSYAIKKENNKYVYLEPTSNPESQCIERIVNHYSEARVQYTNILRDEKNKHIEPNDTFSIQALTGRIFAIGSMIYRLNENAVDVTLLEI